MEEESGEIDKERGMRRRRENVGVTPSFAASFAVSLAALLASSSIMNVVVHATSRFYNLSNLHSDPALTSWNVPQSM